MSAPKSLEKSILAYFLGSPVMLPEIEGRFYYARAKQDPAGDYVTFYVISQETLPTHSGHSGVWVKTLQFSIFSRRSDRAAVLADKIYCLLDGLSGIIGEVRIGASWLVERSEFFEEDTELHAQVLRFRIHYSPA